MWGREDSGACGKATKDTAGKEADTLPMEKGAGAQRHVGYASKRCSIGGKRMENQRGDSNICEVSQKVTY